MIKAGLASIGTMLLTAIHHSYGAFIYQTPWRHYISLVSVAVIVALALTLFVSWKWMTKPMGRLALWLFAVISFLIPVIWIGLFEGGYTHLLKNILYSSGASRTLYLKMFPPPMYETPNDVFFETTGVLQVFLGVLAGFYTYRLLQIQLRNRKLEKNSSYLQC